MKFIADLHIHSRFSRATAKSLNFENLYIAARIKGITVVGTGDFTHPGWIAEISEKLVPAEPGLFKLKDELEAVCEKQLPFAEPAPVRFILSCEISSIYKKSGATRKNHNLVFLPDIDTATRFNARLDRIGNIKSDGRPILGLDARNLLEILLETSDDGFLIPAHIWTPWFSMFGSKSGFDTIEECFEDLTPHIFAVETGLSSDPPMNWRVGNIDGITLVSNSDAHSPGNLGREANLLNTDLSYPAIQNTLKTGDPEQFLGTIEFFPEEGKYHNDGHRNCDVNITPDKSLTYGDLCPACGKPMTLGVLHRIEELATRKQGEKPEKTHPFFSAIPLAEIISEIVGVGPKSKKVAYHYDKAIEALGPELHILHDMPIEKIKEAPVPFLSEAIQRMREGSVNVTPGYDGEYGRVKVFNVEEKDRLSGQKSLFQIPKKKTSIPKKGTKAPRQPSENNTTTTPKQKAGKKNQTADTDTESDILAGLNEDQLKAATHKKGPLLIVAGPGTGKTRTLTCRIAHLIKDRGVNPENILAVTFTNKAAAEMADRLSKMLGNKAPRPLATTFHAFCFKLLKEIHQNKDHAVIDDFDRKELVTEAIGSVKKYILDLDIKTDTAVDCIVNAKQHLLMPSDDLTPVSDGINVKDFAAVYEMYQHLLEVQHLYDYEDLIFKTVSFFESDMESKVFYRKRFAYIFVDEYQDLNFGQYRIIKALAPEDGNICVIGDPDQSIYGFRGSDVSYFQKFTTDFPTAEKIRLTQNYRSSETILAASHQVICKHTLNNFASRVYSGITGLETIQIMETESGKSEAVAVGKTIEQMIGGMGFHYDDFNTGSKARNKTDVLNSGYRAFSDFAVLFRTRAQGEIFADTLRAAGIPCQTIAKENAFCKKGITELLSLLKIIEGYGAYIDFERVNGIIDHGIEKKDLDALKIWGYNNRYSLSGLMAEAERLSIDNLTTAGRRRLDVMLKFIAGYARHISRLNVKDKLIYLAKQARNSNRLKSDPNIREAFDHVVRVAEPFGENTSGFIETAALQSDPDVFDAMSQKVSLMTIHAAKGLEFPVVFIAGCENGLIPFIRGKEKSCDIDEERRLFYVAMTRAKEHLILTRAKKRTLYGKTDTRQLSPFVADIENKLLDNKSTLPVKKKKKPVQLTLF